MQMMLQHDRQPEGNSSLLLGLVKKQIIESDKDFSKALDIELNSMQNMKVEEALLDRMQSNNQLNQVNKQVKQEKISAFESALMLSRSGADLLHETTHKKKYNKALRTEILDDIDEGSLINSAFFYADRRLILLLLRLLRTIIEGPPMRICKT